MPVIDAADQSRIDDRVRAAARLLDADAPASARVANAPAGYLLAHDAIDLARHAGLVSTTPEPSEVRVVVTPGRVGGTWLVDVAARDRPGLLASVTGVLADRDLDVVQAVLATWGDGAALEAFTVRAAEGPDPVALRRACEDALGGPWSSPPLPGATVSFHHAASSHYAACEVRAADRPGLLHALAVAFATAGASVHAAGVATAHGVARDRFDLSATTATGPGAALGAHVEAAIRRHVRDGVTAREAEHLAGPSRRWWPFRSAARGRRAR